jgi:hypothetical protein
MRIKNERGGLSVFSSAGVAAGAYLEFIVSIEIYLYEGILTLMIGK